MLASAASLLNIPIVILDVGPDCPAKQVIQPLSRGLEHVDGSFADPIKIKELAEKVDVLTVEIEHVDAVALEQIGAQSRDKKLEIHPSPKTIGTIQDKFKQKEHLSQNGCPVSEYLPIDPTLPVTSIENAALKLGLPLMLKSRTLAYDGRGNYAIHAIDQISAAHLALEDGKKALYAEKWVDFKKEIAVMVVKGADGEVRSYPAVETVHKDHICHLVFAPLRGGDAARGRRAREVAEAAVGTFEGAGVFGVEMFLMEDGKQSDF
jgi:phosphoribosylaminoimidazole carboxylase